MVASILPKDSTTHNSSDFSYADAVENYIKKYTALLKIIRQLRILSVEGLSNESADIYLTMRQLIWYSKLLKDHAVNIEFAVGKLKESYLTLLQAQNHA